MNDDQANTNTPKASKEEENFVDPEDAGMIHFERKKSSAVDEDDEVPELAGGKVLFESKKSSALDDDDEVPELPWSTREKTLSDLSGMGLPQIRKREKMLSDLTGMKLQTVVQLLERGDHRTASQLTTIMNWKREEAPREQRTRQISSTDIIKRMGDTGNADLRLAESVQIHGTYSDRQKQGISDDEHHALVDKKTDAVYDDFVFSTKGLTSEEAAKLLEKYGLNQLPEHVEPKWLIFLKQFWAPMPVMIWLAIIIEASISNFLDMGILLFIQFANATISFHETTKAGDAVAALKSGLKPTATVKRDGKWGTIDATLLVPGDLVMLGSGSAIPADCRVNHSEIDVDQAALTGESLPVTFYKGDSCKMGSTVVRGEVEATVEFTGADTFFGKTASLLVDTHERSHLQIILMKIMFSLVMLSVLLCAINFAYLLAKDMPVKKALSFTIVLLVASIPLAIEIVTTTTLAIGSKKLSEHGAIVAKLSAIEDLAGMSILISDKTGTLTLNKMVLQDDTPIYSEGETQESVLVMAALAAKWKEPPRDALDRLTLGSVNFDLLEDYEQIDFLPFDPTIKRTEGTLRNKKTGEVFKTTKGAPHVLLKLLSPTEVAVREAVEQDVARLGSSGIRSLAVARNGADGKWTMMGLLTFLDPPRPDTKQTIEEANRYGVEVKMATGDHLLIAVNTSMALGLGPHIFTAEHLPLLDPVTKTKPDNLSEDYGDLCLAADGFAQVFPEHKYLIVECLRELGYTTGMTGDGVNDAPALKRAQVGIAVANATDAARAAADIILTQEGLSTIIHGIQVAREIFQRINNFITYRVAATLQLLCFFFIAVLAFHPKDFEQPPNDEEWPEFFHMPVLMLMLITLLNDGTLITIAYDNAQANKTPDKWNLPVLFIVSSVLGFVSCFSSLLLLWFALDSWNDNGLFQRLGMPGMQYGQVITAMYAKVSISDFLTLFSARTGAKFFWQVPPALILMAGGFIALFLSSILAIYWPDTTLDEIPVKGLQEDMGFFEFIWIYSLIFWFLQDALKVLTYRWLEKTNFNNFATTGVVVLPDSAKTVKAQFDAIRGGQQGHVVKDS